MLEGGSKAAEAFKKGFEANKNNHITRTVRVKTEEEGSKEGAVPTGSDKTEAAGESEKDKKARLAKLKKLQDEADQARLNALKALVAQEDARVQTIADRQQREIA